MNLIPEENTIIDEHSSLLHLNEFISHIIWPLTIFLILFFFRKPLKEVFKRLGSIQASPAGLSFSFDNQIDAAEQLEPAGIEATAKSAVRPRPAKTKINTMNSPYFQLLEIRESMHNEIVMKAQEFTIPTSNKSSFELRDELKKADGITPKNAQYFTVLYNLTSSGGPTVSQEQVNKIIKLFENMQL